ncbi:uncharacterized protein C8R40DRAFT_1170753 [Lentinula edodes]|uniref:uncharacterized protein n=1 Tax=Lentinula edodes TaxID=5353 RepID=UPI001E8E1444|nr:uncharacterized protein C8R40DRAFT_1170753 [Lentinula edodes]KAH7875132.1 hypothetical protein C8R40DRAFT_1170753 [Lentinula edodes]
MTLDQNLFTLQIKPSPTDPTLVDLADPSGNVFYRKERSTGVGYNVSLYDFITQSVLVTATAPSPTGKVKIIELQNPSVPVEFKASGTFSVKWAFSWKGHEFEWKREEECYIIRKPDPPVLIAITTRKESNRIQSATVQILDYNLDRFEIEDRKGLELVILTALLTFLDSADVNFPNMMVNDERSPVPGVIPPPPPGGGRRKSMWTALSPFGSNSRQSVVVTPAPTPPAESTTGLTSSSSAISRSRTKSSPGPLDKPHNASAVLPPTTAAHVHHRPFSASSRSRSNFIPSSSRMESNNKPAPPTQPLTPPPPPPLHSSPPIHPTLTDHHNHHADRHNDTSTSIRPRRATSSGVDLIAQLLAPRHVIHEITVYEEGGIEDYAKFCWRLLRDEAIAFITICSGHSSQVQKVLEVVEATKRLRFEKGPCIELLQFVAYYPLPGGTTLQQRLEDKARIANMSPKEVKKSQKKKEKEEEKKKRRLDAAKSKKGKAKDNDNDPANAELDVEPETETVHPHIPPKSVNVRLTKVEVGKLTRINSLALPEVGQATATTPEEKTKSTKGNMRLKSLQPTVEVINTFMPPLSSSALRPFQILDSSSNKRKYLQDPALLSNAAPVSNARQQQQRPSPNQNRNSRRSGSGAALPSPSSSSSSHNPPPHHHHPNHYHRKSVTGSGAGSSARGNTNSQVELSATSILPRTGSVSSTMQRVSAVSRPELGVPHPANASAATSSSYPTSSSTSPHIIIHAQTSSSAPLSSSSSPALSSPPALRPPPLPPRRSQGMLKPDSKNDLGAAEVTDQRQGIQFEELLVAGPSTLTTGSGPGPNQAPPSYSELLMEDEFPVNF